MRLHRKTKIKLMKANKMMARRVRPSSQLGRGVHRQGKFKNKLARRIRENRHPKSSHQAHKMAQLNLPPASLKNSAKKWRLKIFNHCKSNWRRKTKSTMANSKLKAILRFSKKRMRIRIDFKSIPELVELNRFLVIHSKSARRAAASIYQRPADCQIRCVLCALIKLRRMISQK